jgi:precorrin-6B methylase 2
MVIVSELILLLILLYIIALLTYSLTKGAPYAAIGRRRLQTMLTFIDVKKGGKLIDIGAGDGRITIECAKKGITSYGIEINPLLVILAKIKIKKSRLNNAHIIFADCWQYNFEDFDYITIWGTKHMMKRLEKKLMNELKPGTKVISNHFKFPNWKYTKKKGDVYLYIR